MTNWWRGGAKIDCWQGYCSWCSEVVNLCLLIHCKSITLSASLKSNRPWFSKKRGHRPLAPDQGLRALPLDPAEGCAPGPLQQDFKQYPKSASNWITRSLFSQNFRLRRAVFIVFFWKWPLNASWSINQLLIFVRCDLTTVYKVHVKFQIGRETNISANQLSKHETVELV